MWGRRRRRRARSPRSTGPRTTARGTDLISNFLNSNTTTFVQHRDHITVSGHSLGADRNFDVRIGRMQLKEARKNLIVRNQLIIESYRVTCAHSNGDKVFRRVGRRNVGRRQGDFDSLHVRLAQAHHHEAGEQEEHDVDQRNDLDPGMFFGNGRGNLHT
jgi:hypothetical protein